MDYKKPYTYTIDYGNGMYSYTTNRKKYIRKQTKAIIQQAGLVLFSVVLSLLKLSIKILIIIGILKLLHII